MQNRRHFLKQICIGTAGLAVSAPLFQCSKLIKQPNFVLIVADDMGWDDLALHGNKYVQTPVLDKLAKESVQFDKYYVNPVCAPTRASLLTGRNFLRTGVSHVHGGKDFMALDEVTFADVFRENGYHTGMWGKWHSGKTDGYFPWQRGFDQAYMARLYQHHNSGGMMNGTPVEHPDEWTTDVLTTYALKFIEQNRHQHFFAYLPLLSCHAPLAAREENIQKYEKMGLSRGLATIYAMVERIDRNVKRILDKLDELHLAQDTVVIFMSDNGPAIINNDLSDEDREIRYVNQLRGHKGNTWENGVKSPLFVRWQDHLSPAIVDRLVDDTDLFPTLLDLAGIRYESPKPLDGRSIKPYLYGETQTLPPKLSFNYAGPGWPPTDLAWTPEGVKDEYRPVPAPQKAQQLDYDDQIISVQNEHFKLLHNPGLIKDMPDMVDGYALFDMDKDPKQLNNIITSNPQVADTLKTELKNWWDSILKERNSFAMPIFQIGLKGRKDNEILAYGAQQVSETTICAASYITLPGAGDFAEYRVNIHTPGIYSVSMVLDTDQVPGTEVKMTINDQELVAKTMAARKLQLGEAELATGVFTVKFEVLKPAPEAVPAVEKLRSFQLLRLE